MQPETQLGPYRIIEPLGAGGMGEVYLAEDTRLGRKVAIKVLPAEFAADPERRVRFEQEARAAAALNHPHIATIHDIGTETDASGETTHFMVQELLEGQDLHEVLRLGPLARARALTLGAEIAEALAAAHAAGIVHRDLKPQNIFVLPSAHAKVLDFGLAKLVEPTAASGTGPHVTDAAESPTMLGTQTGMVMGSAGYMAPEQAAGGQVDHRADLFACGCVLYEMLVGERAFGGETIIDTLHAIIHSEPAALRDGESTLDPDLRWMLEKCLSKDLATRYQSAGDLAVDMRRLAVEPAPVTSDAAAGSGRASASWLPWVGAAAALVLGLAAGAYLLGGAPQTQTVSVAWQTSVPPDLARSGYFNVAPDGELVAYRDDAEADASLWLRRLDDFEPTAVLRSEDAYGAFFSPDGRRLGFFADGQLWVVDVAGGRPRAISDVATNASSAVWADDGYIYLVQFATGTGIHRVPEDGGVTEEVLPLADGDNWIRRPRPLPDNRGLSVESALGNSTTLYFFDGAPSIRIDRPQVRYLEDGTALFVEAGQLFRAAYDAVTYRIDGEPVALESGVVDYRLAASGTLAYLHDSSPSIRRLQRYDRNGESTVIAEYTQEFARPAVSPDGSMIGAHDDIEELHVWDVGRGTRSVLLPEGNYFQWGPDSNTVYFQARSEGQTFIDRVTIDESEPRERLATGEMGFWLTDVSADGSALLYYSIHPETERDIWLLPLDGSGESRPFLATPASERSAVFSPDGRWVAYMSDTSGREEVYVRPAAGDGRETIVTIDGGREPRWAPDGSEIFFRLVDGLWAAPVVTEPRFAVGDPQLLFTGSFGVEAGGRNQQYDVFSNGDFLMMDMGESFHEIRVVTNWLQQMEATR